MCENVTTFLLEYDVVSAAALVINDEARCVWSKLTANWGATQPFVTPATPPTTVVIRRTDPDSTTSTCDATTTTCDAATTTLDYSLRQCESTRPYHRRLASVSSSTSTDLGDSTRPTACSTPTAHCNNTSTLLDAQAPSVSPQFDSTSSSAAPPWTASTYPPDDPTSPVSTTVILCNDFHASTAVETLPTVGTFSQIDPPEFDLDEETQLKVIKPSQVIADLDLPEHVNVLFVKTLKEVDLADETNDGLKRLSRPPRTSVGFCPLVQHAIDTGNARPTEQSRRRPPLSATNAKDEILDEMLQTGVIELSNFSWASPVCPVKKKDGSFRFCIDYRRVNAVSKKDAYPIPDIQDALDNLRGSRYLVTMAYSVVTGKDPPFARGAACSSSSECPSDSLEHLVHFAN